MVFRRDGWDAPRFLARECRLHPVLAMPARFLARASAENEEENDDRKNHIQSGDGQVHHLTYLMLFR